MASRKVTDSNRGSKLLHDHENNDVFASIGRRCVSLSTTVVQVYHCGPNERQWQKRFVGVVCFVKDNALKSYFIRVIDVTKRTKVWEHELYSQFKYNVLKPQFHSFEGDQCVVGLNFADNGEAIHFQQKVEEKLSAKQQRKMERRQTVGGKQVNRPPLPHAGGNDQGNVLQPVNTNSNSTLNPSTSSNDLKKNKKNKGGKKPKLTKGDIGKPSDFRHVGHVGWDPKGGFDVDNIDPQWQKLFDTIGVTKTQLEDEETSKFIYEFVENHGGIEKATQELERERDSSAPAPPPPQRSVPGPPPPPSRGPPPRGPAPPPPGGSRAPARSAPPPPPTHAGRGPPPPPSRSGPPPPPPQSSAPRVPPPAPPSGRGGPPPPPPMGGGPPPPPPPPPPPVEGGPPPPPPPSGGTPSGGTGRGGLLDQIHKGKPLKNVDRSSRSSVDVGRNDLLSDIRAGGVKLKTRSQTEIDEQRASHTPEQLEGMAGALAKALQQRSVHIQVSDDDEEEDDDFDDEDEWSD